MTRQTAGWPGSPYCCWDWGLSRPGTTTTSSPTPSLVGPSRKMRTTIIRLLLFRQDQRCQQHLDGRAELPPCDQPQLSADPHGEQIVQSICTSLPCFHQGVHPDAHKHLPKPKARLLGGEALPESFDPRYNVLTHPYCTLHTLDQAVNNSSCLAGCNGPTVPPSKRSETRWTTLLLPAFLTLSINPYS